MNNSENEISEPLEPSEEKVALIDELRQARIKHNPEAILRIAKLIDGTIVFLEIGNSASGLQHIVNNHRRDFAGRDISEQLSVILLRTALFRRRKYDSQHE